MSLKPVQSSSVTGSNSSLAGTASHLHQVLSIQSTHNALGPESLHPWTNNAKSDAASYEPYLGAEYEIELKAMSPEDNYARFVDTQTRIGAFITSECKLFGDAQQLLDQLTSQAGYPPGSIKLSLLRSPKTECYSLDLPTIDVRHIFITTTLLKRIAEQHGELRLGHLAFLIGTEISLLIKGSYRRDSESQAHGSVGEDPIPVRGSPFHQDALELRHNLESHVFSREALLKADEAALRWMRALNLPSKEGIEVLESLATMTSQAEGQARSNRAGRKMAISRWGLAQLTDFHRGSPGRTAQGRGVLRKIEIEANSESSPESNQQASTLIPKEAWLEEALPTQAEAALNKLNKIVNSRSARNHLSPDDLRSLCGAGEDQDQNQRSLTEVQALLVFVPTLFRMSYGHTPFLPFGYCGPNQTDCRKECTLGLKPEDAELLSELLDALNDRLTDLVDAERAQLENEGTFNQDAEARLAFKRWACGLGMYFSPDSVESLDELVKEKLAHNPSLAVRLVQEFGLQVYDCKGAQSGWFQRLLVDLDTTTTERGHFFNTLISTEHLDLRASFINQLLSHGLFDNCTSVDSVIDTLTQFENEFSQEAFWVDSGINRSLGHAASQRLVDLLGKSKESGIYAPLIDRLVNRSSVPKEGADYVVVELVLEYLAGGKYARQLSQLETILPPGLTRDVVLCELIDQATGEKDYRYRIVKPGSNKEHEAPSPSVIRKIVQQARPLFDLSWYTSELIWGKPPLDSDPKIWGMLALEAETKEPLGSTYIPDREPFGYSPVLTHFVLNPYMHVSGPTTAEANKVRSVLRDYFHGMPKGRVTEFALQSQFHSVLAESNLRKDAPPNAYSAYASLGATNAFVRGIALNGGFYSLYAPRSLADYAALLSDMPTGEYRNYLTLLSLAVQVTSAALERVDAGVKSPSPSPKRASPQFDSESGWEEHASEVNFESDAKPREKSETLTEACSRVRNYIAANNMCGQSNIVISPNSMADISSLLDLLPNSLEEFGSASLNVSAEKLANLELVSQVYQNYSAYLKMQFGLHPGKLTLDEFSFEFIGLRDIAIATTTSLFHYFYNGDRYAALAELPAAERLQAVTAILRYPCIERDRELNRILEAERERLVAVGLSPDSVYTSPLASQVYELLLSPLERNSLGRSRYSETLKANPKMRTDFDAHLTLVLDTHPEGSVVRDRALKQFVDGQLGSGGHVKTWDDRDKLAQVIESEAADRPGRTLSHVAGVLFLQEALNEVDISAREKVDTLLWLVGLKEKSHLVRCYEVVERLDADELRDETSRLTDDEKKHILIDALAGARGILRDPDHTARREFLDSLFFAVFKQEPGREQSLRYFKAIYDIMLDQIDPERAAKFLGNFLVAHLEGRNFNQQVKLFFESFGFVGIKTAQYLVSSTTMIQDDLREVLLDLTSRVEGPDKRVVFSLIESTYGADIARRMVKSVGDYVGGGSLMSFYEVELWSPDGSVRRGVIGVLRPEIIHALPEDLLLVHRIIECMDQAPEVFGGRTVSMDLMENLLWQSLVETDLSRTIDIQKKMRAQLLDLVRPGCTLSVPEVWESQDLLMPDGEILKVSLNQGPLIFMEHAKGKTLDLFIKDMQLHGEAGEAKLKIVANRVAEAFWGQLTRHGLLHCDLHPGNILVHEDSSGLHVTILDVGLSTELPPQFTQGLADLLGSLLSPNPESQTASGRTGILEHLGLVNISDEIGLFWAGEVIQALEQIAGETWSRSKHDTGKRLVWEIVSNPDNSIQKKIAQVMELSRELNLNLPRQFFYALRGVSVMNHIWRQSDWSEQSEALRTNLGPRHGTLRPIDADAVLAGLADFERILGVSISKDHVKARINRINSAATLPERISVVRTALSDIFGVTPISQSKIWQALWNDQTLRNQLGLDRVADTVRALLISKPAALKPTNAFVEVKPLATDEICDLLLRTRAGMLPRNWKGSIFPGSVIRELHGQRLAGIYIVLLFNDVGGQTNDDLVLGEIRDEKRVEFLLDTAAFMANPNQDPRKILISQLNAEKARILEESESEADVETELKVDQIDDRIKFYNEQDDTDLRLYVYFAFQDALDKVKWHQETKLGDLLRKKTRLELHTAQGWVDVRSYIIQTGETREEYTAQLALEMRRLGKGRLDE